MCGWLIISAASIVLLALIKLDKKGSVCKLAGREKNVCAQTQQKTRISPEVCGCAAVRQPASHRTWNDPESFRKVQIK